MKIENVLGFLGVLVVGALLLFFQHKMEQAEAKSKEEEKRARIEQAAYDKKEEEINRKQLKVASAHLNLPEENVMMLDGYDNDFGDYEESEEYGVVAKGVEYVISFNQDVTKVDKFVELPKEEYCSDSDSDSDSTSTSYDDDTSTHKIKVKKSKK